MNNNKQKLQITLIISIFVLAMVFAYLLISFILWDLNASHWPMGARVLYAIFGTGFSAIIASGINLVSR